MVPFIAIIFDSLSKQFYRSFSNINPGSIVGGRLCLKEKRFVFKAICGQRGKFCVAPDGMLDYNMTWVESPRFLEHRYYAVKYYQIIKSFFM